VELSEVTAEQYLDALADFYITLATPG